MRDLNKELHDHLHSGSTTTCTCWIVKRRDGVVMGFTDHDNSLTIDNVTCEAVSGFNPTQAVSDLGLATDNQDIEGAISSDAITEEDLRCGKFDGARVEVWIVNWKRTPERHHLRTALLGEVVREEHFFKAELRGLTSLLNEKRGRTYSRRCDATLGDKRCGVDLTRSNFRTSGSVVEVLSRRQLRCDGLALFSKDWFSHGNLTWKSGRNAGSSIEVTGTGQTDEEFITLWKAMPFEPETGDAFELTVGCDKQFSTCREKFNNGVNFQGYPHLPGSDFAFGYAKTGELHNGDPLVK